MLVVKPILSSESYPSEELDWSVFVGLLGLIAWSRFTEDDNAFGMFFTFLVSKFLLPSGDNVWVRSFFGFEVDFWPLLLPTVVGFEA